MLKILSILIGWYNFVTRKNTELMGKRLLKCAPCEQLRYDKEIEIFYCGVCECPIKQKASNEQEKCPHYSGDKWNN